MARDPALARSPLFEGLDDAELDIVAERMRARQFAPDEQLCRAGDPSDRIWLITGGGPNDVTYTLVWSIQNDAFGALEVGLGTAQSLVLFVLLIGFIGWQLNQYRQQYNV